MLNLIMENYYKNILFQYYTTFDMENYAPKTFSAFLNTIVQAEAQTDQLKSKLFFFSQQKILHLFHSQKNQNHNQNVSVKFINLLDFFRDSTSQSNLFLSEQSQKVLIKYFGFQEFSCSEQQFLTKLKPVNSKLINQTKTSQHPVNQLMFHVLQSILKGYKKIKTKRQQCAQQSHKIISYFKYHLDSNCLNKESLKQFMYETNNYSRLNFNYLKSYIFGEKQEKIQWSTLFRKPINIPDQIKQLSEENIVTEQRIITEQRIVTEQKIQDKSLILITPKNSYVTQNNEQKSILIQSISEIKAISEPVSKKYIQTDKKDDYSKALSQISHIEQLLNKTKQKYQKNRQDLQSQSINLKNTQLKRCEQSGILRTRKMFDYSGFKIQTQISAKQVKTQEKNQKISNDTINQKFQTPKRNQFTQKDRQFMLQSNVKPFISRQMMKKQINDTPRMNQPRVNEPINYKKLDVRQIGKIKRRSVSKDKQVKNIPVYNSKNISVCNSKNTSVCNIRADLVKKQTQNPSKAGEYSQYEAVLKQIHAEQQKYSKLVKQRENYINQRKSNQKVSQNSKLFINKYTPVSSLVESQATPKYKQTSHNKSSSQSRFSDIMKEIQNNNLSRSRISSKKRQEIVHKATSQARLRIQEIQNRALNRISKLDIQSKNSQGRQKVGYLNLKTDQNQINQKVTPKYEKQNSKPKVQNTLEIRSKFFMNDLLNQRPSLKLSSANFTKY